MKCFIFDGTQSSTIINDQAYVRYHDDYFIVAYKCNIYKIVEDEGAMA